MKIELSKVKSVACTSDCWTSLAQQSFLTVTAHFIDDSWTRKIFTLETTEMDERHTSENLWNKINDIFESWDLKEKISTIVTDNAANVVKAVNQIGNIEGELDVTCAAHTLQLAVNDALASENIQEMIKKASKIVGHFKHSNVAKYAPEGKQKELNLPVLSLLQCNNTRWNLVFLMLERLIKNKDPVMCVLSDTDVTTRCMANKLAVTASQWMDGYGILSKSA